MPRSMGKDFVHPSRQDQVPSEPSRKRHKAKHPVPKSFNPTTHPVNQLKAQVRSLKRLLERADDLPADVRVEKERALQTAQYELGRNDRAQRRNAMIGRYHKIRFFDRQKATKRAKKAKKEFEACGSGESEQLRASLRQTALDAEVDINYAIYFPLEKPYVSLFPRRKEGEEESDKPVERKGDPVMWARVRQCMADGTLDDLRNGRLDGAATDDREPTTAPAQKASRSQKPSEELQSTGDKRSAKGTTRIGPKKSDMEDEVGSDSDGGFFE